MLPEEEVCRRRDAVGIGAEEDCVEVHVDYLFLGVVAFQFDGCNPLLEFDPYHSYLAYAGAPGVERLCELLRNGGTAAL